MSKQRERLEQMSEKELLVELTYEQQLASRRTFHLMTAVACVAAVLVIVAVILVPKLVTTLNEAKGAITEAQGAVEEARTALSGIQELVDEAGESLEGIDTMVGGVNTLVENNTDTLTESIAKMNQIDFDSLNSSIQDLQAILEPLAKFFNVFG